MVSRKLFKHQKTREICVIRGCQLQIAKLLRILSFASSIIDFRRSDSVFNPCFIRGSHADFVFFLRHRYRLTSACPHTLCATSGGPGWGKRLLKNSL